MFKMTKTTLKIEGMMCGMCEAHMNDAIRSTMEVKNVTSSHKNGETVIISENPLDEGKIREAVKSTGYTLCDIHSEAYTKKDGGLFSIFKKN